MMRDLGERLSLHMLKRGMFKVSDILIEVNR